MARLLNNNLVAARISEYENGNGTLESPAASKCLRHKQMNALYEPIKNRQWRPERFEPEMEAPCLKQIYRA
jgi:hypothetical protein